MALSQIWTIWKNLAIPVFFWKDEIKVSEVPFAYSLNPEFPHGRFT